MMYYDKEYCGDEVVMVMRRKEEEDSVRRGKYIHSTLLLTIVYFEHEKLTCNN